MADFAPFDTRGYRTVDVRSGYGEWVATYEQTVEDAMDIELLESLETVRWEGEVADLGCGTGRTGAWLAAAGRRGDRRRRPDPGDARRRPRARRAPLADRGRRDRHRAEDEHYDLVVTSLVDEHLVDLRPLYAEAYRLAKPGATTC